MGIAAGALWCLAALGAGAWITRWLELKLRAGGEPGPAWGGEAARLEPVPSKPDPWLYSAAPVVALLAACWAMAVIPFGPRLIGADLGIGLFYFLVVADFLVLAIALGGWGANTPDSVEACYRSVAQLISYVVPLGLAVIGPAMMARSLSTQDIVNAQMGAGLWYAVAQPLGFALYIATALMQTYRPPFLEPFAGRIGRGVMGVYGGWKTVFWKVALSGILFVTAAMGAALFLGGWAGPLLPAPLWMLIKTLAVMILMLWLGERVSLLSTANMLELSWKVLIPVGLLNVLVVGALILLGVGQDPFR